MGCDIHSRVQIQQKDGTWKTVQARVFPTSYVFASILFDKKNDLNEPTAEPFNWRNYGMFAFLADVRNYSHVPPISEPRGLPSDVGVSDRDEIEDYFGDHSFSWLGLDELLSFDYEQVFEDRRCTRDGNGVANAGSGNGIKQTFREFLGPTYFRDLDIIRMISGESKARIVFGFDN